MDEIIWITIGVVALLIAFGAVGAVYHQSVDSGKETAVAQSIVVISDMCAKVCRMPVDTYLSVTAELPSGAVVSTNNDTICIAYGPKLSCRACGCTLQPYALDLNTTEAKRAFNKHEYSCYFKHLTTMTMDCRG